MADDRLDALLLRWEDLAEQGVLASPEELCRDCPDLLDELRVLARVAEEQSTPLRSRAINVQAHESLLSRALCRLGPYEARGL